MSALKISIPPVDSKSRLTNNLLHLRNSARQDVSYYYSLIESHVWATYTGIKIDDLE